MKRSLWITVMLLVIGVLWFSCLPKTTPPGAKRQTPTAVSSGKPAATPAPKQPRSYAPDGYRINPPIPEDITDHERFLELKRRRDEAGKKVATLSTPESRARIVDKLMQLRGSNYQSLFASWNLAPQAIHDVLAIIRERELQASEHRNEYFKDISGKHKEFASNKVIDNEIAKLELERLLGRSRYAELVAAEKRMGASELSSSGIKLRVRN